MIQLPATWVQHFGFNLVTAYPPDLGARFRYYERIRPCISFARIVEKVLAGDPDFRTEQIGEMARIVTREGEYGAWVRIDGNRDGAPAVRFVGAVFMEDFASALECVGVRPRHFAELQMLSLSILRSASFRMTQRPRRFFYVPPVGWHGIASGAVANWYPLDFPANLTNIVVPPAEPITTDPHRVVEESFEQLGLGLAVDSSARDELTANGIKGTCLRLQGMRAGRSAPIFREMAMFVVNNYAYRMQLETAMGNQLLELREVFRGVVESFRPLPSADEARLGDAFKTQSHVFDHWVM